VLEGEAAAKGGGAAQLLSFWDPALLEGTGQPQRGAARAGHAEPGGSCTQAMVLGAGAAALLASAIGYLALS
jgi:hypothetical protein